MVARGQPQSGTQPGPATVSHPTTDSNSDDEVRVGLGDLVAIVLSGSTPVQPLVELRLNSDCKSSAMCHLERLVATLTAATWDAWAGLHGRTSSIPRQSRV